MRFYLGGPINGCTDAEAHDWREEVKNELIMDGHTYCDPMDRDYRGRELEPGVIEEIVEGDKRDIRCCDVLFMNAPKPSWGTAMEILYGHDMHRRVVVILPHDTTPSPWIVYHADLIMYGSAVHAIRQLLVSTELWR